MTEEAPRACRITAEFTLLARDYFRPVLVLNRWNLWFPGGLIIGFVIAFSIAAAIRLDAPERVLEAMWFIVSGRGGPELYSLLAPVVVLALFWNVLKAAFVVLTVRMQPLRGRRYTVTFSDEGLSARAEDLRSELNWSSIRQAGFARGGFVLRVWTWQYLAVPRRAFASDADYEAACDFVLAHLPPKARVRGRKRPPT